MADVSITRLGGIGRTVPVRPVPAQASSTEPAPASPMRPARKGKRTKVLRSNRSIRRPLAAPSPIHKTTFFAALMLAAVSGGYSIFGMASIFTGAMLPVIGMGVALEIGKLSAVSWFGAQRGSSLLRASLFGLVAVLMVLNAIGAYGFLARAHIGASLNGELSTMGKQAETTAKITATREQIADLDKRIAQIDEAVSTATRKGRTNNAMELAAQQHKTRDALNTQRAASMSELTKLTVEGAQVEGQRKLAQADLGPALYLATLLGVSPDAMLRAFILLVACLLDPAAVLLLMAATSGRRRT